MQRKLFDGDLHALDDVVGSGDSHPLCMTVFLFVQIFVSPNIWNACLYLALSIILLLVLFFFKQPVLHHFQIPPCSFSACYVLEGWRLLCPGLVPLDGLVDISFFFFFPFSSPSSSSHPFWFSCWLSWTLYFCLLFFSSLSICFF